MNLRESAGIALTALRANKMRSFLTLLGTIIGVASVIAVLSLVEGLNRYVSEKLVQAGSNVFWVDKYGFITSQEEWENACWARFAESLSNRARSFSCGAFRTRDAPRRARGRSRPPARPS